MPGMMLMDDTALALISHAAQERLKYLIEQVKLIAHHRTDLSMKVRRTKNMENHVSILIVICLERTQLSTDK